MLRTACPTASTTLYIPLFSTFDKNGKSFGEGGDKDGEFKDPFAVAVRDDGYVFVSDTGNNRVQIFK